jgi:hypothetical protein
MFERNFKIKDMENETLDNTETGGNEISASAKANLRASAGWVKAFAILGFIGGGFMVLGSFGLFMLSFFLGLMYLVVAGVTIYMAVLLLKQANSISSDNIDYDTFASSYLMYWKIIIILIIVSFVMGLVGSFAVGSQVNSMQNFPF